ncbi:MAG: gephyrin-like molybdotransferase Glp, partial [Actinomycetes bacterium]
MPLVASSPRSVDEHRAVVAALLPAMPAEHVPVGRALGRVLAADVVAGVSLPSFDNSAMDGYAVRSADVAAATAAAPVELPVAGDIPAGTTDVPALAPG